MAETNPVEVATSADVQLGEPDEVEVAKKTLVSLNPADEAYFSTLNGLANGLMSRFRVSRNPDDLDEGIVCFKQALNLAQPGHSFHLQALGNLGGALTQRFKFRGQASDITEAIDCFETAVEACEPEQSDYIPLVANLAMGLLNRYRSYGDLKDIDRIIDTGSTALSVASAESPNRDALLDNLANAFKERFEKLGNRADLDVALTHYESSLELRPPGHRSRHSVLGNLADAMLFKFEVDGHVQDLESAATHYVSALELRSPGQDGYLLYLSILGIVYWRLFNVQGDTEKMEMAIGCYETAMAHSTVPNLDHSRLLDNYGAVLQARYTLSGNMDDLDRAIQYLTTSSNIQPPTYTGRPTTLFNLGAALITRFNAAGSVPDLDSSIDNLASALQLCEPGYHQRPVMLSVYGRALCARFSAKGDMEDLQLAVSTCKDALASSSPTELNYASTVANLTATLLDCFYRSGNIDECQAIIDHCDRALVSARPAEPAFDSLKINRAKAFLQKYQFGREETDINACVDAFRDIIPTLHQDHAEYVPVHLQFGIALQTRFKLSVDPKDMDEAITLYRVARRHCQRGNMNYAPICMQLGNALRESFEYDQSSGDALDEAIVLLSEVEDILSPTPGQSDYKASLINLGAALFMRFQVDRNGSDLDAAVERVSLALTLPTHSEDFLVPFTLATLLSARYSDNEDPEDLERSVQLFGVAAERMPPKHLVRGTLSRNYGHALVKLARHRERLQNLEAAIVSFREALEFFPPSHYDQPLTYQRLAEALHERAKLLRDSDGVHASMDLLQGVMQTLPADSPMLTSLSHTAAKLSMSMYGLSEQQVPSFMEDGFQYYEQAARGLRTQSFMSVYVALEWVDHAEELHHSSALRAYQTSLDALNHHLLATASIKGRRATLLNKHLVKRTGTLATDATACAIARNELELAVELSEQGRGLLWAQLSQSRTPLDALRSAGDEGRILASNFERVSAQLAQSTTEETRSSPTMGASHLTMEEAARRYKQLSKELDDIVDHIRRQPGFESFMDRSSYRRLQCAAVGGPVILVNASRQRCDALIILRDAAPRLVPLPDTTLEDLTDLSAQLYYTLKTTRHVGEEKTRERQVVVVLRALWDTVVHPIVNDLATFLPRGTRIWWCPTSTLTSLPLHAAGQYRKGGQNLPNTYVSSYTPTLAALVRAREQPTPSSSPPTFVAIGQANPASSISPQLPTVSAELALVRSLVPASMPFSALEDKASTADAALTALATHGWAHLACHGQPNLDEPFDAAFALRDRAVTVLDIVRARSPRHGAPAQAGSDADAGSTPGEFAFLSACHTAVGDARAPDEIIHLAAAMQFAGFRSVVGTMWAVDDAMAMAMVRAFYAHMGPTAEGEGANGLRSGDHHNSGSGSDGPVWESTQAARALNRAAKAVDKDAVSIDQRIVFIHIGA